MGEALITRRGGGFNFEDCNFHRTTLYENRQDYRYYFSIPTTIDFEDIKGYVMFFTAARANVAVFASDGNLLFVDGGDLDEDMTISINVENRTIRPSDCYYDCTGLLIIY